MLMTRKKSNPWAKRLKALREQLDITQAEAAARIGLSTAAWISWENSQRTPSAAAQQLLKREFPELN